MAKYVVIVHDDYGRQHTSTPILVEARGKAAAIGIAMESASHAWNIGITKVEVHLLTSDNWHVEGPADGNV